MSKTLYIISKMSRVKGIVSLISRNSQTLLKRMRMKNKLNMKMGRIMILMNKMLKKIKISMRKANKIIMLIIKKQSRNKNQKYQRSKRTKN